MGEEEEIGGLAWDDLDEKNLNERMKKAALHGGRLLEKNNRSSVLPLLSTRVTEVALVAQHWWEFGQTVARVHFDTVISATTGVGWLEGSVESGVVEGDKFEDPVSNTFERAAGPIDNPVGVSGNITFRFGLTNHLLGDFNEAV